MKKGIVIGIIIGVVLALGIGVYAAVTYNAKEIGYKNKTVEKALDELYKGTKSKCSGNDCLCKRATELHSEICNNSVYYGWCSQTGTGYSYNSTMIYGLMNKNNLGTGDAFDCDVNGDGIYDKNTERFYYMTLANETAVLIYYSNVSEGVPTITSTYAYSDGEENNENVISAIEQLPTTEQWPNVSLTNNVREVMDENGTKVATYDYSGKAARLLTAQEINAGCGIVIGSLTPFELYHCKFLHERSTYADQNNVQHGFWLETKDSNDLNKAWRTNSGNSNVRNLEINNSVDIGVRPAIEVSLSDIDY